MKYPLFCLLLVAVSATSLPDINATHFQQLWFNNLMDHFNYQDTRTFRQRYWINDEYWDQEDGPVFLYICGEYTCSVPTTRLYPFMVGASYNALLMVLEHRYYGASQLFDNWETKNMKLLSADQALADIANFIYSFNANQTNPKRFILVSGSYPAALSAWFREKYPHLAIATWASSPSVQQIVNFTQFDLQVYYSTLKSGSYCPKFIQNITNYVTKAFTDDQDIGLANQILEIFDASYIDKQEFMFFFADIFVISVQYSARTEICDLIKELQYLPPLEALQRLQDHAIKKGVFPSDYSSLLLQNTTIDENKAMRQWSYQYCTELGFFQIPNLLHPLRSRLIENPFWYTYCQNMFPDMNYTRPFAERSVTQFGGDKNKGTHIFFTNGGEDPWQPAGNMTSNPALDQVARIANCTNCGHCAEIYTPKDSDPVELTAIRTEVYEWIGSILDQTSSKTKNTVFLQ